MSRFYARDIRDEILTHLQDSSSGINNMLLTIDTERGTSLATKANIRRFSGGPYRGQLPELFIKITGSEREAGGGINETIDQLVDTYEVDIMIMAKDYNFKANNDYEIDDIIYHYEEALKRTLHAKQRILDKINYIMYKNVNIASVEVSNGKFYDTIIAKFIVKSF